MLKRISLSAVVVCLVGLCGPFSYAEVREEHPGVGVAKGGDKPLSVRWTGTITAISKTADGYLVTLGTSYYPVGTGLVNASTKIKINSTSGGYTGADLRIGDQAQMDVLWPSRVTSKMEVIGLR